MAVMYSQNGVMVRQPSSLGIGKVDTIVSVPTIVDKNGYIGRSLNDVNEVIVDPVSDFSSEGLGQLDFMGNEKVTIGEHSYDTTSINGVIWLAENLDYKFSGCDISTSDNPITGEPTTPTGWYYRNDETSYGWNGEKRGLLYNWYAVKYLDDNRATLIPGWHVPTYDEWNALRTYLNSDGKNNSAYYTKMSSSDSPSWNGSNAFKFNVMKSNSRRADTASEWFGGNTANYWSSSESSSNGRNFYYEDSNHIGQWDDTKTRGYSIRLVKDSQ